MNSTHSLRLLLPLLCCGFGVAWADGGARMPAEVPNAYRQECASCHVAYPPGLLPAASWKRLMNGLEHHYGSDASIDAQSLQQLSQWLQVNAGSGRRAAEPPPEDRITRTAWFEREHRKIDPSILKLPSVKSPANCAACHGGAERGRFSEHDLRQPAGMTAQQRRNWINGDD